MIRPCTPNDAAGICAIYNHYVSTTVISFEEEPVAVEEMARRIEDVSASYPWLVWEEAGAIAGYAYATRWKPRAAYRHAVESTIYLAPEYAGRGIGRRLYGELMSRLREAGIHSVVGGIALPNDASVRVHEAHGFRKVAHFTGIGFKFDRWIDVGYWELLL